MEEGTGTTAPNRTVMILLVVVIVLLAAVVGYLLFNNSDSDTADTASEAPAADTTTDGSATSGMPGTTAETPFDAATATKVAEGVTPEQHVTEYFDAVVAGDYQTAYALLPTDKQASYGTAEAFGQQLKDYGVTDYTIDSATEEGDEAQITATANMPGGAFQYLWTFVKDGEGWLVKSRTLPGMGN